MRLADVARLRLRNQRVAGVASGSAGAGLGSAEEVVRWLGVVQSQEYQVAKWTLGMRVGSGVHVGGSVPQVRDADIDALLASGRILRTHILRPTWHFVLPDDIRWMQALTGWRVARVLRSAQGMRVPDEAAMQAAFDVLRDTLAGGRQMTRRELAAVLLARGAMSDAAETTPIFMRAELDLVVASGGLAGPGGRTHTYALLDEVAPATPGWVFDRDWALAELTRRYFTSHGPATIADFAWWSGLTVADTNRGLEINGSALPRVDVDGTDYWWAGDVHGDLADDPSPTIHLMQGYDEYIVAYKSPRRPINLADLLPAAFLINPPLTHAIILDGQGIGFWRPVEKSSGKSGFVIETKLVTQLSKAEGSALAAAVDRYGRFVDRPVGLLQQSVGGE